MSERDPLRASRVPVASRRFRRPRMRSGWLLLISVGVALAAMAATLAMLRIYPPPPGSPPLH